MFDIAGFQLTQLRRPSQTTWSKMGVEGTKGPKM